MKAPVVAALCCLFPAFAQDIRIAGLDPTVLFPKNEPLRQIAILRLDNRSNQPVRCRILVRAGDGAMPEDLIADLAPGITTQRWDPLESTCRHASLSIL